MIGKESLPRHGAMFGMQDPSQTLVQIERYMDGGRLELSEVMATQFCDLMLSKKKREPQDQVFLLKGLRLMCDIYLMRNKADQSLVTIKRMHRERKALVKLLQKHAPNMMASMQPEEEDHLRAGRLYAAAGKAKPAKKSFAMCERLSPGHLLAALHGARSAPTKPHIERFIKAIQAAGDVILANGQFQLQPENSPAVMLEEVLTSLDVCAQNVAGLAPICQQEKERLQTQHQAILQGEQAANARLQSALDNLEPKHDYYQYG